MTAPAPLQRAVSLALRVAALFSFIAPLLTRATLGYSFFLTGRGKLDNFQNTVTFFTELGIPMPELNAAFVSRLEYYGGALLVVGLLTRLFAAGLAGTMLVAVLTSAEDRMRFIQSWNPAVEWGPMDISPWVFLILLVWLVFFGPGLLSLDALAAKLLGLKTEPEAEPKASAA